MMATDRLGSSSNHFHTLSSSHWAVVLRQLRSFSRHMVMRSTRSAGYESLRKVGVGGGGVDTGTMTAS